jgi:hypothetical protein
LLDIVNRTHQDEFTKFTVPSSRTHGVAERALDRGEDGFTHRSLAVSRPIDPRVMRVIDGPELTMFDKRSYALFTEFIA